MTGPTSFLDPAYVVLRCDLTINDVQATVVRPVSRDLLAVDPGFREHAERELRLAVAEEVVRKLAPPVFEVQHDSLRAKAPISRAEALRLAHAHGRALAELCSRLAAAGENYAVTAAQRAADGVQALVEKLESHEGRLPERPAGSKENTT